MGILNHLLHNYRNSTNNVMFTDVRGRERDSEHAEVRANDGGLREVPQLSCRDSPHPRQCSGGRLETHHLP